MKESERVICAGQIYRHFKGNLYQIVTVAIHSETGERLVVYQRLYGDYAVYARPYDMFLSQVDTEKYPDATQKYRFELADNEIKKRSCVKSEQCKVITDTKKLNNSEDSYNQTSGENDKNEVLDNYNNDNADSRLIEFLDADTFEEKRRILINIKQGITDRLIDDMAAAIDVTVDDGDIDTRFMSLLNCINTRAKYEVNRFR